MKTRINQDYSKMTATALILGLIPYKNRSGKEVPGFYTLKGLEAPIDLTASAEDEISILKNALKQLSKEVDESYQQSIERDLKD